MFHLIVGFHVGLLLRHTFVINFQISSLFGPLIQLVKSGFTKPVQRLDGVYALLLVGKIAAIDIKAGMTEFRGTISLRQILMPCTSSALHCFWLVVEFIFCHLPFQRRL